MKPINKLLLILAAAATIMLSMAFWGIAHAASLSWDYPGDNEWNNNLVGYTIYYSNPDGVQFLNTIYKSDVAVNATRVIYGDIEDTLHLQYDTEYTFYVTAFDASQESDKSNACVWTQAGYEPPEDVLPPIVIHVSGPVTVTIEN